MRLNILASSLITLIGVFSVSSVMAQTANLTQIYDKAQSRDAVIATANSSYAAGKEKANQGLALLLPNVSVSGAYADTYYKDDLSVPDGKRAESTSATLTVVQPLYNGNYFASYRQGKLAASQAKENLTLAEQDLIIRVAQSYFNVLSAQESVRVAEAQKRAFSENLDRAKLTFKVGTATITDKLEAQARYDLAIAEEIAASNALEVARQSLASIIGELPPALADLKADATLPQLSPVDMNEWISRAKANSPMLKVAQQSVAISREELSKARSGHMPTLSFVANATQQDSYSYQASADNVSDTYSVAVQLQMPIFAGGMAMSQVREAHAMRDGARAQLDQTERTVVLQTQQAYLAVANGRLRVQALQQALASNQSAVDATKKGLEVGVRTNLDLLNAQQQFFATQRDLAVAKYNYLLDTLRLKSATGILLPADLNDINQLLQG